MLDADIYGHSIPHMLGIHQKPVVVDKMIVPPVAHDLRLMSIGFFLDDNHPVMWRGPMLHRALEQFLSGRPLGRARLASSSTCRPAPVTSRSRSASCCRARRRDRHDAAAARAGGRRRARRDGAEDEHAADRRRREHDRREVFGAGRRRAARRGARRAAARPVPLDAALRESGDAGDPLVLARSRVPSSPQAISRDRAWRSTRVGSAGSRRPCRSSTLRPEDSRPARGRSASRPPTPRRSPITSSTPSERGKPGHGCRAIDWLESLPELDPSARPERVVVEPGYERWDGSGALGYLTLAAVVRAQLADPPATARVVVARSTSRPARSATGCGGSRREASSAR